MSLRRLALVVVLLGLLPLRTLAEQPESLGEAASLPQIGPIRIVLLDGCEHAIFMQAVARTRTSLPATIDSRYVMPAGSGCTMNALKIPPELIALAKAAENEQQLARRHHQPIPLTIFYFGSSFYEVPKAWKAAVDRLARVAILIAPSGNLPQYQAADIWPSGALKIGSAPAGEIEGSRGKAVSAYVDFDGVEVVINGQQWTVGATSTAAMLFVSHLGNVLSAGAGGSRTPAEIQARLKAALHEEIVKEDDLEARLVEVLQ